MDEICEIAPQATSPSWYVMRAYKCEKKAEDILLGPDGLQHFIPKQYALRVYHGVKSKRLVPVIPSLVFVQATKEEIVDFKIIHNNLQFVMWEKTTGTEHLIVPDEQMENFIKVASHYNESTTYYKPEELNIEKGTRVRIHGGEFDGVTGIYMQVKGKRNRRLVVVLEGIMAIAAEVQPDLVEVLS